MFVKQATLRFCVVNEKKEKVYVELDDKQEKKTTKDQIKIKYKEIYGNIRYGRRCIPTVKKAIMRVIVKIYILTKLQKLNFVE